MQIYKNIEKLLFFCTVFFIYFKELKFDHMLFFPMHSSQVGFLLNLSLSPILAFPSSPPAIYKNVYGCHLHYRT